MRQLNAAGVEAFMAADWDSNRPFHSFWTAFQGMRSVLSRKPAQILHSHSEFGDVAALLLKASAKPPIVVRTVHNGHRYEWRKRPLRRLLLTNLLYPLAFTAEIGVNPNIVDNLNRRWIARILGRRAIYVPNAIDLDRFADMKVDPIEKRHTLCLPPDAFVVGTAGRLAEGKGLYSLLEAAAIVSRELPQVYFVLIGDGELTSSLRELAHQLQIADRVVFAGPRSDVEELLACLDLFVSSSLWEGLSTVILESMASGIPVVATEIPGNQAIIQDRVNGSLVPPNDPEALASAIINALRKPSLRNQYAYRALRSIEAFSINDVAVEHEALYLKALGRQIA
jgi:glycosyltransferase involved in cell wall biosynthesis